MIPVVAILGRPNVGKSTLFNQLTGTRDALVAALPGLTRDRQYGTIRHVTPAWVVIDTGGLGEEQNDMAALVTTQAEVAIHEADHLLLLVDARSGVTPVDAELAIRLRRSNKPITLVVNKIDGLDSGIVPGEFFALALGEPIPIAAAHGRGIKQLLASLRTELCTTIQNSTEALDRTSNLPSSDTIRVALIGKPNAGKSTLINQLLGETRVLTHSVPGTTRDSIFIPFKRHHRSYVLIDTAGVRRRTKITQSIEKFSVVKTLQAIEAANIVIYLFDALAGFTEHDAHLLGHCLEAGRGLVIAINKWDQIGANTGGAILGELERRLRFFEYTRIHQISARDGTGLRKLMDSVDRAWSAANRDLPTPALTRVLRDAIEHHRPPSIRGRRIKLRYAHQGGTNPPCVVIHGNQTEAVPDSYTRYLANAFIKAFALEGTPVRVQFKRSENPFKHRSNTLTERQLRKRRRLMRYVKRERR